MTKCDMGGVGRFKIYQLFQINLEAGILDLFMEIMTCDFFRIFKEVEIGGKKYSKMHTDKVKNVWENLLKLTRLIISSFDINLAP